MTNKELLLQTEIAVKNERNATAEVVRLFAEIQERRLYLDMGYPTLFEMATKHFGLCNQSAWRRISAMRLIRTAPEVEAKIQSGEISLSVAASLQSFIAKDKSVDVHALVETCAGKSTREVERELARINPEMEKREHVRQVTETRVRVSYGSSNQLEEKLEKIRLAWSHVNPNMSREELLERMADQILRNIAPKPPRSPKFSGRQTKPAGSMTKAEAMSKTESMTTTESITKAETITTSDRENDVRALNADTLPARDKEMEKRTRYIPTHVKSEVMKRNAGQGCEFVSANGRRCASHNQLQFDHIKPYSLGGANTIENLRVYCAQHNRHSWRQTCTQ